jgi:SOS-response transcriptional repressor LexA
MLTVTGNPLGELVSTFRQERRWSREDLAAVARKRGYQISGSYIQKIELGVDPDTISAGKYDALAAALGTTSEEVRQIAKGKRLVASEPTDLHPSLRRGSDIAAPTKAGKLPPLASFIYSKRAGMPVNDLARAAGVAPLLFDHIDAGHVPADGTLKKIAAALGADFDEVKEAARQRRTNGAAPAQETATFEAMFGQVVDMPYFGKVGCGEFLELAGPSLGLKPVPVAFLQSGPVEDMGVLEAWGNSMNRTTEGAIHPGMLLLVRTNAQPRPGQIVIATVPFQGTTCKRFVRRPDGDFLVAESTDQYPDIPVVEGVRIDGVVLRSWADNAYPS